MISEDTTNTMKRAFLAGMLIAFAGIACTVAGNAIAGAFLFSLGILAVLVLPADLYTGKVGYYPQSAKFHVLAIILIFNLLGAIITGVCFWACIGPETLAISVVARINMPIFEYLFKSILCGVFIYLSVELYKKTQNPILAIIPIMAFVLSGGQHCIANAFYFAAAGEHSIAALNRVILAALGNALGSVVIRHLQV